MGKPRVMSTKEEQITKESEDCYQAIFNLGANIGEAIIMLRDINGREGMHTCVSDQWLLITGYTKEELLGMSFFDLVASRDREASINRHRQKMSGKSIPGLFELSIINKSGKEAPIELTSAATAYKGQKTDVVYARDITERKWAERELKQYQQNLEKLVEERTAALKEASNRIKKLYKNETVLRKKLEKQIEQRKKFSRILVHELKTPLTPIRAASELLTIKLKDKDMRNLAQNIHRGALSLDKRINELMDLSKSEIGVLKPRYTEVDPLKLIEQIISFVNPEASNYGIKLSVDISHRLPIIYADEDRLSQIMINLLINAIKFTPYRGAVVLKATSDNEYLIIEVLDTGKGISAADQKYLFQPYYSTHSQGNNLGGMGVGLALCKTFVELHKGKIWFTSQPGKGSSFGFRIPIKIPCQTLTRGIVEPAFNRR